MLVEGHYEVLDDLERARPGVYDGWPRMRSRAELLGALRLGIAYPDMPCGAERLSRRTGRVRVVKFRLCSSLTMLRTLLLRRSVGVRTVSWLATPSLVASTIGLADRAWPSRSRTTGDGDGEGEGRELDMQDPYQLLELYQSHLGTQAHLHAMSPGLGDATVGEVTHRIVRQLLILAHRAGEAALAGDRSYAHWLGMMLHVLTDSYTPGHVVRVADAPLVTPEDAAARRDRDDPVLALDGALYRMAKATAGSPHSPRAFRHALPSLSSSGGAGGRLAARVLYHAYLRYVMHHQTDARLHALIPDLRGEYGRAAAAAAARRTRRSASASEFDVINYSHYDSQPAGYHLLHDRLELIRERPAMYRRMLDECAALLDLFKDALKSARHRRRRLLARASSENDDASVLGPLIERVLALLTAGPFRVRSARDAAAPAGARYV